jgi:hypothetical protein
MLIRLFSSPSTDAKMWSDSSMAIAILSFLDQVCFLIIEHKDSFYKDVFRNERFPPLLKCFEELKNHFKNYLLIMLSNEFFKKESSWIRS